MRKEQDIERILVAVAVLIVGFATVFDVFDDWGEGATLLELFVDIGVSSFVIGTLIYIWIQRPRATKARNIDLERMVNHSNNDLALWKSRASKLLIGLGSAIDQQFDHWHLSKAEKEVSLLLIKGFSLKEIAAFRGTGEKTARQQASSIYTKAKLDNRAELSAFFLEDLLLP